MLYRLVVLLTLVTVTFGLTAGSREHPCSKDWGYLFPKGHTSLMEYGKVERVKIDDTDLMLYCAEGVQYRDFKIEFEDPAIPPVCLVGDFPLSCDTHIYEHGFEIDGKQVKRFSCYDADLNEENLDIIHKFTQTGEEQPRHPTSAR